MTGFTADDTWLVVTLAAVGVMLVLLPVGQSLVPGGVTLPSVFDSARGSPGSR